jgi:hypothetical protein
MLCTIKMLQPCIGNFTLPRSRLNKSLNHVNSVSHVCHKHLRGMTPGAFDLESCGRWMSLTFPPLAGSAMFMCQWTLIHVIAMPPCTMVRPLSMSLLIVCLSLLPWVNPNSSKPTMTLHTLQLLFSVSVRPIRYITPPVLFILLKHRP